MCVSVSLLNNIGVPHEASICFGPSLFYEGLPQVEPGVFGRQGVYRGCRTKDRPQMGCVFIDANTNNNLVDVVVW